MKKKDIAQVLLLLLAVGGGIYYLVRQSEPAKIQILCDIHPPRVFRNNRARVPAGPRPWDVVFGFDGRYELTSVEIVPLEEWKTNKDVLPVWHLVSESNSAPVKAIFYGSGIRGMHPAIKGSRPQSLETNITYRLTVTARGSRDGECNFKLPALPQTGDH